MKEVIIGLGKGQLETGFDSIDVELKQEGRTQWKDRARLAPAPELRDLLNQWQLLYPTVLAVSQLGRNRSVVFEPSGVTNFSKQDIQELNSNLRQSLNHWLDGADFNQIIKRVYSELNPEDPITIAIVSDCQNIWQLPWHFWDFFKDYPHAVEVFYKPRFTHVANLKPQRTGRVNMLGLFGQDPQLELNPDFLQTLPQSTARILTTNSAHEIADTLTQDEPWDIFIFNGHGDTVEYDSIGSREGIIYLDATTSIEIGQLKIAIERAVERGLQIAIFNCCRGLGLAEQLSDVNLPYIIVMREKIPDRVAQQFLADLLGQYSRGQSFPTAFRYARERLKESERIFAKFADWLPVLFHNPLSQHVTWQDLCQPAIGIPVPQSAIKFCHYLSHPKRRIWTAVGVSLLVSILSFLLQSVPLISGLQESAIDRVQFLQASQITPGNSQVTLVNYDELALSGRINDSAALKETIDRIERQVKPIVWLVEADFDRNSISGTNILVCDRQGDPPTDLTSSYSIQQSKCSDPTTISRLQELIKTPNISQQVIRLNPYLLDRINQTTYTQISQLALPEIQQLFDRKFILIGTFEEKSTLARDAIALDRLIRAKDPKQPIPLFTTWENGGIWLWMVLWSTLVAVAAWRGKWWLLVPLTIGSQLAFAWVLLTLGQGVPIAIGTISTSVAWMAIALVKRLARSRLPI
jgi:hypothetical protein